MISAMSVCKIIKMLGRWRSVIMFFIHLAKTTQSTPDIWPVISESEGLPNGVFTTFSTGFLRASNL